MASTSSPTVVYLGASRGVGFAAYSRLAQLRPDIRSILLLRNPERFQSEEYAALSDDIKSRTVLFKGDAHNKAQVEEAINMAGDDLEAVVFTIGFQPPNSTTAAIKAAAGGFKLDPPDICTRALTHVLVPFCEVYARQPESRKPRLVINSSMGMGAGAHKCLPFALKMLYTIMLKYPHQDKIAMEVVLHEALIPTPSYPSFFPSPSEIPSEIITPTALAALPKSIIHPSHALILRPALFTDGPEKGVDRVRAGQEGEIKSCYTISRLDVGGFAAACLADKDGELAKKWFGKQVVLAY